MSMYESFAEVYDTFMDNVPYEAWGERIITLLHEAGIRDGLVLDLGCGTGAETRYLRDQGYDMIGVDNSLDMLEIAREQDSEGILYLLQDMREFELYGTVRAIVSVCDCVNYILEKDELLEVFKLANNYLDPKGLFIFDMNTPYKYREIIGDQTIAEAREDSAFIWDNRWDEEEQINEYDLSIFIEDEDGRYERYDEVHTQRGYALDEVKALIQQAGLELVAVYDGYTDREETPLSERWVIVARECIK